MPESPIELWQQRRWRRLLLLIDHLPRHSPFSAAVADDDEYAEMLLAAEEKAEREGKRRPTSSAPSMMTWTPEVGIIADLFDNVTLLRNVIIQANSPKGTAAPDFKPYTRPRTALERVREARRWAQHNALADRVLARRKRKTDEEG